ncbi:MAG: glycosyltransferase 87 family protein [Actinomycetota bacterium]
MIALALVVASAVGLAAGYALKAQCNTPRVWDGYQFRHSCYNDVLPLYAARGLEARRFPYIHSTAETRAAQQDLEYPVGTGLYVGNVAMTTTTPNGFFNANAVGLALMGIATTLVLAAMALDHRRVLLFAIGPAVILYAFHNWDLLAVGLTAFALYAFWREAEPWAGFLLGLGAATKLYPAFLLPALLLAVWKNRRRIPWEMGASFVLGVAVLNVPIMLANFEGWKYPWDFQGMRTANFETSWFMLYRHVSPEHSRWFFDASVVNLLSGGLFVAGAAVLLALEARRRVVRPYALGFALLAWFLVTAKVFSPQYALWLLPFFALLRMPWWSYVAFAVTDAAVWFAVSGYFLGGDTDWRLGILEVTVWARYAALLTLIVLSRRVDELVRDPEPALEAAPVPLNA